MSHHSTLSFAIYYPLQPSQPPVLYVLFRLALIVLLDNLFFFVIITFLLSLLLLFIRFIVLCALLNLFFTYLLGSRFALVCHNWKFLMIHFAKHLYRKNNNIVQPCIWTDNEDTVLRDTVQL